MKLHLLPARQGGAAENMAADFLLLKRYPFSGYARFRHYGWHRPACTFGYSQRIEFVRRQTPAEGDVELCRRPTGGGVVDHRDDWTYALVLPRGHALADAPAPDSYRAIHEAIARVLRDFGEPAELKAQCDPVDGNCEPGPTVCFEKPERYDVMRSDDGRKIAGAAQKRTKEGLLCQGSLARGAVAASFPWTDFRDSFARELGVLLGWETEEVPWPEYPEGEWEHLTEQYAQPEWNTFR